MIRAACLAVVTLACVSAPFFGCSGDASEPIDDGTPRSSGGVRNSSGSGNNNDPFDDDGSSGDTVGSSSSGDGTSSGDIGTSSGDIGSSSGETSSSGGGSSGGGSSGVVNPGGAAYGEACDADADCESGICNPKPTGVAFACSKPCQTSAECDDPFFFCQLEVDPNGNPRPNPVPTCREPEG